MAIQARLSGINTIAMAAVAAGFVVASILSLVLVKTSADSTHQQILGEALVAELAQQVNIREDLIRRQLTRTARSSLTVSAVTGTNADILEAETQITAMIPFAERVRIIPLGQAKTDQGFPPFNYVALDLAKSAEAGENPRPEVISSQPQLEGDRWIIVATPIQPQDGNILGTLFVYLGSQALTEGITDGTTGEIKVMQAVGGTPKPVAVAGTEGSSLSFEKALNNPNWMIHYSPTGTIAGSTPLGFLTYLVPALTMMLIALAGILIASRQSALALDADLSTLSQQISRVTAGDHDDSLNYTTPGFVEVDEKLAGLASTKPAPKIRPAAPAATKPVSPGAEPEIVEIEITDDDANFLEVQDLEVDDFEEVKGQAGAAKTKEKAPSIEHIFRAYDIRGIVGESLSEDIARSIGLAVGSEADSRGEETILVGYDGREYSPALAEALMDGITAAGLDVINIGAVPTPVLYFGTHTAGTQSGVMVTGSHNPPEYNGFKIVIGGKTLIDDEIKALHKRIVDNNFSSGSGSISELDLTQDYIDAIADDVVVAQPLKVVVDCGNGIAGAIAPELFDALGCETVPLYCEVDGSFPNHHPDPTRPENLKDLIATVQSVQADLGIGIDGDGDRLVAVTADGEIVWPDQLLMLFAKDIVSRNPGSDVVYDVKCTRHLNGVISGFGGRPIISRSGHSYIKAKVAETGALLGGEMSGHICFAERWFGFDDGLYSSARLLEIVGSQEDGLGELLKAFPVSVSTPEIQISVAEQDKFALIDSVINAADFEDASLTTIDGLRVDFADGWGLIRASNTEPALTLRFEADNDESLEDIKGAFRELLQEVRKDLDFE